ncbi:serine protease FAM111A-like [Apodemus sylvaticus]|uniref:serine protease FAM111A-like n=1 Tax=Apodemus sylvaticus TaxID=10129 RepID=UPI0022428A1A|nr:serine protease FAM111A-like [Apodemus sylvaticus]XP_052044926.1 serine protease FAM111A-like [Apodemus sylvaticus]XP_052044934.1 serine protease FAM111A-like [Apodemus sylvaticus]XP_052044944.1 serine protease FAM111A-like [Apodemus sylvaticus]XP_052044955.1 serine protease FAM111A-like [Apodemus sylvaticus]XP_052044966.1 serine protease FAM111A-like [Apodemus sylvaticus]XP_052044976.1 serine protease FAM111A-like [Apodemus sylvaticus]XP_052044982.1 serine protease FAM111A-like [Apodemus
MSVDITKTRDQKPLSPKNIQQDQTPPPNKTIDITLDVNSRKHKNMKQKLTHRETSSLYTALNSLEAIKQVIESQKGKEMQVCGIQGIEGYLNLSMPLCCIPQGSHVSIRFCQCKEKTEETKPLLEPQDQASTNYVRFYIHAIGSKKKKILKCGELHKPGNKLCVYGSKGETIRDILRKDGRFCSFIECDDWKLISDLDTVIENTQPIDELEDKLCQIETELPKNRRVVPVTQNSGLENGNFHKLEDYIVDEYPTLQEEGEKLRAYIKEMSAKIKNASLFKVHKEDFGKKTKNSTPVKVVKHLSRVSDSVGFLWWNNNGNEGCATCFVFKGLYILTCRHVITSIVGKGIDESEWASIISQCVKVTFDYEEFALMEDKIFVVKPWFEISDKNLDYAVLELKENGKEVPAGLYNGIGPAPHSGLIYIIGHPEGEKKSTDGCAVVPQYNRTGRCQENFQSREEAGYCFPTSFIHMFTQRSFQEVIHNPDVITYDTTFFGGSSGSPVFDSNGSLVAMHAAGFICTYEGRVCNIISNIIEFGSTMESIVANIKQNEQWYNKIFANDQDVEMLSTDS